MKVESTTKDRWLLRLFVLTLFAIGFCCGAISLRLAQTHGYFQTAAAPQAPSDSMEWVLNQAQLRPDQRAQVVSILNEHLQTNRGRISRQMKRQYRERFLETDQRLREILTPEQHRRYRKALNQWVKRRTDGLRIQ